MNTISTATPLLLTDLPASAFASYPFSSSWSIHAGHTNPHWRESSLWRGWEGWGRGYLAQQACWVWCPVLQTHSDLQVKGKSLLWFMQAYIICPLPHSLYLLWITPLFPLLQSRELLLQIFHACFYLRAFALALPPYWEALPSNIRRVPSSTSLSIDSKVTFLERFTLETQHHSLLLFPFPFYIFLLSLSFKKNLFF